MLAAAQTPAPGNSTGETPRSAFGAGGPGSARPEVFRALLSPGDLSASTGTIVTNIALTGLVLVLVLLTATIFNQTVQENSDDIGNFFKRLLAPVSGPLGTLHRGWHAVAGSRDWMGTVGVPLAVLGLTGIVYGLAEPGFGFNDRTLVVFSSLVLGLGSVTYVYSGGQALLTSRHFGIPAGVRVFPIGLAVAAVSVAISRLEGFQPGIIYGFIASCALLTPMALDRRQTGHFVFFPALALLAACLIAWALVSPFRDLAGDSHSWLAAVPEATAAAVFVGGLEGLFFNMIPLRFMDGHKLWQWNRLAWATMTGGTAFLFWQVLLNREKEYFSALEQTTAATALALLATCLALTVAAWVFFHLRVRGAEAAG